MDLFSVSDAENMSIMTSIMTSVLYQASWENGFSKQSFIQALSHYKARLGEGHMLGLYHSQSSLLCHILPLASIEFNNK